MTTEKHEYKRLMSEESGEDNEYPQDSYPSTDKGTTKTRGSCTNFIFIATIVVLLLLNTLQFSLYRASNVARTEFAGLKDGEIQVFWNQSSDYIDHDDDVRDHLWDRIDIDSGIVAVPKSWAKEKGLPAGTTFPWDNDKALYFVNAYHSIHCLKNVYRAFRDQRLGLRPSVSPPHVYHCLDQLLADVFCHADDTLRATNVSTPHSTAANQFRQCRSWDALQEWTLANPGCYRYGNHTLEDNQPSQLPRLRFCPEGSPELERVRKYFGKGKDWRPAEEKKWSWFD